MIDMSDKEREVGMPTLPELRMQRFLTQRALAEMLGVHHIAVSAWEQGKHRPSMEHLRRLCEIFDVGPLDIEWPAKSPGLIAQAGAEEHLLPNHR
jgi:transcriptional regulator with XRE-family HTH domain